MLKINLINQFEIDSLYYLKEPNQIVKIVDKVFNSATDEILIFFKDVDNLKDCKCLNQRELNNRLVKKI